MTLLIFPQSIYINFTLYKVLFNKIETVSKTNKMSYYFVHFTTQLVLIQIT